MRITLEISRGTGHACRWIERYDDLWGKEVIGFVARWWIFFLEVVWQQFWTNWIGTTDQQPVFFYRKLASWRWRGKEWTLRIHKFVGADDPGCFHTHPAVAYRLVIWNGYHEEIVDPYVWINGYHGLIPPSLIVERRFGHFDRIEPSFCHRIDSLRGKVSYSLWIHGEKEAEIGLYGWGWPDDLVLPKNRVRK